MGRVGKQTTTYETFSSIVHVAQLEAMLIGEGLCQRLAQCVRM